MGVFLDNQPVVTELLGHDASIGQVLDLMKSRMAGSGRLILGLKCNDEDVDASEIEAMFTSPISDFDRLDFTSGRPEELVLDALDATRRAFEETYRIVREAADALNQGRLQQSMDLLGECFGIWGQTSEAVATSSRLLGIDLDSVVIGERSISGAVVELFQKLREVKAAIESRDHVLLGDILRYELDDIMRAWDDMLAGYIRHIDSGMAVRR